MAATWSVCRVGEFRFKEWEGEDSAVYDVASGDTHVVDALAMEVLHLLGQRAHTGVGALVDELRNLFDGETDDQIAARIEQSLYRLQAIGLAASRAA